MESIVNILLLNLAAGVILMVVGWLLSLVLRNVTIVDSLWGIGFVIMAWLTFVLADGYALRRWTIAMLVTAWGVRLSIYLFRRNRGKGEDPRYNQWRRESGGTFWLQSLFKVFLLQALFMWVIALALQYGQLSSTPARWTVLDSLGVLVWGLGFAFEAVADAQLARFKSDPNNAGQVMDQGLWAYSRHPNYFGETVLWWGLFLMTAATPGGLWLVLSPLVITIVLLKMTGIPLTERVIMQRRPGYAQYVHRTSAFIPWFPRKEDI